MIKINLNKRYNGTTAQRCKGIKAEYHVLPLSRLAVSPLRPLHFHNQPASFPIGNAYTGFFFLISRYNDYNLNKSEIAIPQSEILLIRNLISATEPPSCGVNSGELGAANPQSTPDRLFIKIDLFEISQFHGFFPVCFVGMYFAAGFTDTAQAKISIGCVFISVLSK